MEDPSHVSPGEPGNGGARGGRPDLAADLRALGENLREALRAAWASEERERLQAEIEGGLSALKRTLGQTFDEAARDLRDRERNRERMAGFKAKVAGVGEEIRGTHVGDRVRAEIHDVLQGLNDELRRSRERWTPRGGASTGGAAGPGQASASDAGSRVDDIGAANRLEATGEQAPPSPS